MDPVWHNKAPRTPPVADMPKRQHMKAYVPVKPVNTLGRTLPLKRGRLDKKARAKKKKTK